MAHIQTVLGPVDAAGVTGILPHEHLLSLTPGGWLSGGGTSDEDQVTTAVGALRGLRELGIDTVVDLSPYGVVGRDVDGANVTLLRRIAELSGLHVVTGTAVYLESFSPAWARDATLSEMTRRLVDDATVGIGGSTITAGVLGEQATSLGRITPHEEKCLRASARAHRETGLALCTHTTHGTMALEQIEILRQERVLLDRVVIGHVDTHPDTDYVRTILATGVMIAFDTIGKQHWDFRVDPIDPDQPDGAYRKDAYKRADHTRADRIATLVAAGFVDQILLSHDLTGSEVYLNPDTHGFWGYSYLARRFTPMLRDRGVTQPQLDTMTRTNPTRMLTIQ
ncbi:phosphotriesterase [Pseudonocardia sp. MH-G8]|uniref:phosphotriesterase family protein n=1 Tax=Pseudonocardia sp. MH-G8 TaxID=1854588 RepID=UPI000BA0EBCD|nr:aryldialkylphosphatase [Pseudonocardia sp. MH-G8]OZM75461.1 aryldialkylphosphatase [Pseudonocardia sp. MH-G8]